MAITICVTRLVRCAQRSGLKIMVLNKGKTGQWPRQHVHKTAGPSIKWVGKSPTRKATWAAKTARKSSAVQQIAKWKTAILGA
ncbi:MAG TPA: hypothetical protein PLX86_01825 [Acidovorax defluvii]|jgi:hypothetical protein|nr:hypothetical protein [Acidovorax defluvii]